MARPEDFEDFPDWEKQGAHVVSIDSGVLSDFPDLAAAFYAVIHMAGAEPALEWKNSVLSLKKTEDEKAEQLERAQETWDKRHAKYLAATADPRTFDKDNPAGVKNEVDRFATANGLPTIDWPPDPPF